MTPNIKTNVDAQRKRNGVRATESTTYNPKVQVRNDHLNQNVPQQKDRRCAAQRRDLAHHHARPIN